MSLYPRIEPASDITFRSPVTGLEYLSLSMAQVKRLRARGKFHAFTDWARARADRKRRVFNLTPRAAVTQYVCGDSLGTCHAREHDCGVSVLSPFELAVARECHGLTVAIGDDVDEFSSSQCDSCGSRLAGSRQAASGILDAAHVKQGAAQIIDMSICVDCALYHANGDLPDVWS